LQADLCASDHAVGFISIAASRPCRDDEFFEENKTASSGHLIGGNIRRGKSAPGKSNGTVYWLFREYKIGRAYLDKVAVRSRDDYEWAMDQVCNTLTKKVIASAIAL
jgi:hypothetical protein